MKKHVKAISLAVVACLVLGVLLTGCGSKGESVDPNELAYQKLVISTAGNGQQKDNDLVEAEINKYLKEKINAEISLDWTDHATYGTKLPLMLQSGEQLDLVWLNAGYYLNNVTKKAFTPLDDLLEKYGQDIVAQMPQILLDGVKYDGITYAMPVNKEYGVNYAYYFKKDLADKYDLDVANADTYDEMEAILKTIKENEPGIAPFYRHKGVVGFALKSSEDQTVEEQLRYEEVNGISTIRIDNQTNKIVNLYEIEPVINEYKTYQRWNELGYFNSDASTTSTGDQDALKAGKAWNVSTSGKPGVVEDLNSLLKTEMVKGPQSPVVCSGLATWGSLNAIPTSSADPERAMMLLNLLHTDEYLLNLFVNGIEGKHWVEVGESNGRKVVALPEGIETKNDSSYYPGVDWIIGNLYLQYLWDTDSPQKFENLKAQGESAIRPKSFGFIFQSDSVKTEIAALSNTIAEYGHPLYVGARDVDSTLEELNKKLYANGLQNVIDEAQRQYDEWLAKNN